MASRLQVDVSSVQIEAEQVDTEVRIAEAQPSDGGGDVDGDEDNDGVSPGIIAVGVLGGLVVLAVVAFLVYRISCARSTQSPAAAAKKGGAAASRTSNAGSVSAGMSNAEEV